MSEWGKRGQWPRPNSSSRHSHRSNGKWKPEDNTEKTTGGHGLGWTLRHKIKRKTHKRKKLKFIKIENFSTKKKCYESEGWLHGVGLRRQQQASLGEFQVILLYLRSSRATRLDPLLKRRKKDQRNKEKEVLPLQEGNFYKNFSSGKRVTWKLYKEF